jgi:hypothetical protein
MSDHTVRVGGQIGEQFELNGGQADFFLIAGDKMPG